MGIFTDMSIFSGLSGASGVMMAGAVGAVAVGAAVWVGVGRDAPDEVPAETVAALPQTEEVAAPAETEVSAPAAEAPAEEVAAEPVNETPEAEVAEAPAEAPEAETVDAPEPEVVEAPAEQTVKPDETAALVAPSFDEVRRESDGMTVIAGQAAPGAEVSVILDGEEITKATADGSGKFATLTMIAPDGQGHILTLLQTVDGRTLESEDQIILAPLDPPVVVAQVEEPTEEVEVAQAVPAAEPEAKEEEQATVAEPPAETEMAETAPTAETAAPQAVAQAPETEAPQVDTAEAPETPATETAEAPETPATETAEAPETPTTETAEAPNPPQTESAVTETAEAETITETVEPTEPQTEQVAVLKATDEGVELLNTTPPEVMENVAIDTISYSDVGEVQLAGRAQTEARAVRVYLDNTAIVSLSVDDQGRWRGDLPNVDEGIYTLRVDEVAEDGSVTSRVETPFKREDPEVLAVAAEGQNGPLKRITVQKGNTLWAIAEERYGNGLLYVRVFNANQSDIRDPNLIYPGQIFDLPEE